jgi:hypothetical protein
MIASHLQTQLIHKHYPRLWTLNRRNAHTRPIYVTLHLLLCNQRRDVGTNTSQIASINNPITSLKDKYNSITLDYLGTELLVNIQKM